MKKFLLISLFVVAFMPANAQSNKEYEEFLKQARSGFTTFTEESKTEYKEFRRQCNERYAQFLRGEWKKEEALPIEQPKPEMNTVPPVYLPETDKVTFKDIKDRAIHLKNKIRDAIKREKRPEPVYPIEEEPAPATKPAPETAPALDLAFKEKENNAAEQPAENAAVEAAPAIALPEATHNFVLYGTEMEVRLSEAHRFKLKEIKGSTLADMWEHLSTDLFTNTVYDCLKLRNNYHLPDWAYLQMIGRLADSFYGKETNESAFFTAYVYIQSGYNLRFAIDSEANRLYLLIGTKNIVVSKTCYQYAKDEPYYFVFNGYPLSFYMCHAPFEGEQLMRMEMDELPQFEENLSEERTLQSKWFPSMTFTTQVNKNIIDYFNDYPQSYDKDLMTRWAMMAETPVCQETEKSLIEVMKSKVEGLSQEEALERILNFVQSSLTYEFDDVVWGCDRPFFADESLFYPYCDCEDRSILFSRLVRNILGLKMMLVYYPGHLATAVAVTDNIQGDYIMHNGEKYVVCDPTIICGHVGATMTGMDNESAQVILLN